MDQSTLAELLVRCGNEDSAAFRELYDLTSPRMFGVTLRILRNRVDAEEALQDAYLKIWRSTAQYQTARGSAVSWMMSIARNQAIDLVRTRKGQMMRDLSDLDDLADPRPGPEADALASDDRQRIAKCLDMLLPGRASAVRAAHLEGYSYEELARRHGVPLNTMRTWLRRSLISLRACLAATARGRDT